MIAGVLAHHARMAAARSGHAGAEPPPGCGTGRSRWRCCSGRPRVTAVGTARPADAPRAASHGRDRAGERPARWPGCCGGSRRARRAATLAGDQPAGAARAGAAARAAVRRRPATDHAVQPPARPDQAAGLAGAAARRHLAGPVAGQRRRRRGQPGWRELAAAWLRGTGWATGDPRTDFIALGRRAAAADLRRRDPARAWLAADPGDPEEPGRRDGPRPATRPGSPRWPRCAQADPASAATTDLALRRVAAILAAKGGTVADITVGDCLELLRRRRRAAAAGSTPARTSTSCCTPLGIFPAGAAPTVRAFADARAAQRRAAGRPLRHRLPAGPRPAGRLPAGTPARRGLRDPARAWPTPWAGCSGGTWSSTIPGSTRCACPPTSRPRLEAADRRPRRPAATARRQVTEIARPAA